VSLVGRGATYSSVFTASFQAGALWGLDKATLRVIRLAR